MLVASVCVPEQRGSRELAERRPQGDAWLGVVVAVHGVEIADVTLLEQERADQEICVSFGQAALGRAPARIEQPDQREQGHA